MPVAHCPICDVFVYPIILCSMTGSPLCSPCQPGSFNNNTGGDTCTSCSPGVFVCVWSHKSQLFTLRSSYEMIRLLLFFNEMNQNWFPFFSAAHRIFFFTSEFHFLFAVYARYFLQVGFPGTRPWVAIFWCFLWLLLLTWESVGNFGKQPALKSHAFIPCLTFPAQLHRHTRHSSMVPDLI